MELAELTWRAAARRLSDPETVVVVPIGSTEQHGDAGPLGTDWLIPREFCRRLEAVDDKVLVTPVIPFGVATQHMSFPGTIDLGPDVFAEVVSRVFDSLHTHGARRFVVINGHGGNSPAITAEGLKLYKKGALCALIDWWSIAPSLNPDWVTGHGDAQEISAVMAFREDLIDRNSITEGRIRPPAPDLPQTRINTVLFEGAPVKIIRDVRDTVDTGGIGGLPSCRASREWGVEMMDAMSGWINRFVARFRTLDLPTPRER